MQGSRSTAFFLREYRGICINSSTYRCTCNSQLKTEETKLKLNCFQNKLKYIRWKESKHLLGLANGHFLSIFLYVTDFSEYFWRGMQNADIKRACVCVCFDGVAFCGHSRGTIKTCFLRHRNSNKAWTNQLYRVPNGIWKRYLLVMTYFREKHKQHPDTHHPDLHIHILPYVLKTSPF